MSTVGGDETGGRSSPTTAGALRAAPAPLDPLLLLAALIALLGLQLLRVFLPLNTFYFYDALALDPLVCAGLALLCLATGFAAPWVARRAGERRALAGTTLLLAAARLGEQGTTRPDLDMAFAGLGCACFALALPLLARLALRRGDGQPRRLAFALALGIAADTALHSLLLTLDLAWRPGFASLLLVASLVALSAAAAAAVAAAPDPAGISTPPELGWSFLLLGPWLFLQLVALQNVAALASRSGWGLPAAAGVAAAGNALGLFLLAWLGARPESRAGRAGPAVALPAATAALIVGHGAVAAGGAVVAQAAAALLLARVLAGSRERPRDGRRVLLQAGLAQVILVALMFLYYGSFEYPVGVRPDPLVVSAALTLAVALAAAGRRRDPPPAPAPGLLPVAALAALLLMPLPGALAWQAPPRAPAPLPPGHRVRVMTFNLHQGFDRQGWLGPEALARVIESSGADVVALQEVSRGWVVNGSLDLYEWLRRRLRMDARFGATAGRQWGNALLSRYPIRSFRNVPLPPSDLPLERGFVDAEVDLGGDALRIIVTHLHHRHRGAVDAAARRLQVEALLRAWDGASRTVLAGDLNDPPEAPSMSRLRAAGLRDVLQTLPPEARFTHQERGARQQIDYLWLSPDLAASAAGVVPSQASDHYPVVATVVLDGAGEQPASGPGR